MKDVESVKLKTSTINYVFLETLSRNTECNSKIS